jgi:predicted component of type VI protein secretion system
VKALFAPQLVALSEGANIALDKPVILVGRHQECDIQIPSRKISRRHCCLAQVGDHLVVRDLGSTNGIRINGVRVVEGNLQAEDELTIGNMRYQLKWGTSSEPTLNEPAKNGIKVAKPAGRGKGAHDQSYDMPMPIAEDSHSHPILESKPKAMGILKPIAMEIPDRVELLPIEPPPKSS